MIAETKADVAERMKKAVAATGHELAKIRTGKATTALLDGIRVEYYGNTVPLNQAATLAVPEPRMITVQVWDKGQVSAVEKAIRESELGLNPQVEGQLLRLPIPELNEERRQEIAKVAHKYAEQARVAVRNVRRDGMEQLKKHEKDGDMGQDEHHAYANEVQELTDRMIKEIDDALAAKESEIMQV